MLNLENVLKAIDLLSDEKLSVIKKYGACGMKSFL